MQYIHILIFKYRSHLWEKQAVFVSLWLTLLNRICNSNHILTNNLIPIFMAEQYPCVYPICTITLLVGGQQGGLHILALMGRAAITIDVHISLMHADWDPFRDWNKNGTWIISRFYSELYRSLRVNFQVAVAVYIPTRSRHKSPIHCLLDSTC